MILDRRRNMKLQLSDIFPPLQCVTNAPITPAFRTAIDSSHQRMEFSLTDFSNISARISKLDSTSKEPYAKFFF